MKHLWCSLVAAVLAPCVLPTPLAGRQIPGVPSGRLAQGSTLPARLRIQIEDGLILAEAGLGTGKSVRAAVDIGLPAVIACPELIEERGLIADAQEEILQLALGSFPARSVGPVLVRLGSAVFEDVPLRMADVRHFLSASHAATLPLLWLGIPCFAGTCVVVDPEGGFLSLLPQDTAPPRLARSFPIEIAAQGVLVPVRVANQPPQQWIVSTATKGCLVPYETVRALNLPVENQRVVITPEGSPVRIGTVALKEVSVGPVRVGGVSAVTVLMGQQSAHGVLGTDVLLRHSVWVNYPRRMMSLGPRRVDPAGPARPRSESRPRPG